MSRADKEARKARKRAARKAVRPALWEECREKFSLDDEDIRKAKELGFVPEKLLPLPQRPSEKWKLPPNEWIRAEYGKYDLKKSRKYASKAKYDRKTAMKVGGELNE